VLPNVIAIGGIYLPIFLGFLAATAVLYLALRWVLLRLHAYRLFWHPALAGAGVFVILLSTLLLLFGP
tara:strand:- start:1144 stop:1347 length:204 start_codon:yes stop_codon:yes gene_type:complete